MDREQAYLIYREADEAVRDGKEEIKALRRMHEQAGSQVKQAHLPMRTMEELQVCLAAIREAVAPIREQIAEVEAEIKANQRRADHHFDVWKGLIPADDDHVCTRPCCA